MGGFSLGFKQQLVAAEGDAVGGKVFFRVYCETIEEKSKMENHCFKGKTSDLIVQTVASFEVFEEFITRDAQDIIDFELFFASVEKDGTAFRIIPVKCF